MISSLQQFGNQSWTQDKLERVRKYLVAYSKIMNNLNFNYMYIDGFAGTGYHELKQEKDDGGDRLFPEAEEPEVKKFLDGSARIALQVEPRFQRYVFIEKSRKKAAELHKLRDEFPDKRDDIEIKPVEANACLQDICRITPWRTGSRQHRAVMFIDPFGMQLSWETLKAVAVTEAIDTWILFPVSAVNRLLKRDGEMRDSWRYRLDSMFGEPDWYDVFFPRPRATLFDNIDSRRKLADMTLIGKYFNDRLSTIFADVASNPYTLRNTRGVPLFLLCFAVANPDPKASRLAIKIAQDILKRESSTPRLLFPMTD
ncbi:three-Cys-motif partner protein TcmP [Tautonia rosea]|uniref:three-Cys-motif partner protein TcmP n=1 Tax=Tautonia rosea TaxID=2728037 RepID=UPI0019D1D693|nr:three-Cys-motif partner protein TcmP [Tautonia rosea]